MLKSISPSILGVSIEMGMVVELNLFIILNEELINEQLEDIYYARCMADFMVLTRTRWRLRNAWSSSMTILSLVVLASREDLHWTDMEWAGWVPNLMNTGSPE
ncbi:MAG: hypothetical protein RSG77_15835 [Hafnia sp.]